MNNDQELIEQMQQGCRVGFFLKPQDKMPAVVTVVESSETEFSGKTFIKAKGINDWLPFYHFKPWNAAPFGASVITFPLDTLHKTKGI